ncbi:endonuclease domain-containing protein [Mycolicibacterium brumae]|uniref:endonuclease domain-containing protein n=1 Tax=Mycolicibacterium brumae TaxID=85968 RepID=UPI001F170E68|nr:endonuclease domain-containing protein [Mycolicibacterium brumae]
MASGVIANKYQLRRDFTPVFPGIYLPIDFLPESDRPSRGEAGRVLRQRTEAAWLWSGRQGVIAGSAAIALRGAKWVDHDVPIDLLLPSQRSPAGIVVHRDGFFDDDVQVLADMRVTTVARTVFDLCRWLSVDEAVARVDALANVAVINTKVILELATRHRWARNVRRVKKVLDLHDRGARSPKESWLRLVATSAGFPRPKTQIEVPIPGTRRRYFLDMGWEWLLIGLEYDGEHHRTPRQVRYDLVRMEELAALGWIVIRVAKGTAPDEIIRRLQRAWDARQASIAG